MRKKYTCNSTTEKGHERTNMALFCTASCLWRGRWSVPREATGQCPGIFSNHFYPIFLRQGLSLNLDWVCWLANELQGFTLTTSPSPSTGLLMYHAWYFYADDGIKLSSPCLPQALYSRSHFPVSTLVLNVTNKQNFLALRIISFDFKIRSVCKVKRYYRRENL